MRRVGYVPDGGKLKPGSRLGRGSPARCPGMGVGLGLGPGPWPGLLQEPSLLTAQADGQLEVSLVLSGIRLGGRVAPSACCPEALS